MRFRTMTTACFLLIALLSFAQVSAKPATSPTKNPDVLLGHFYRCGDKTVTFGNIWRKGCIELGTYYIPSHRPGLEGYTVIYNDDNMAVLNYPARFEISGDERSSWLMMSWVKPQPWGLTTYTRQVARVMVNCSTRYYQTGEATFYAVAGNEVVDRGTAYAQAPTEMPPNTIGDMIVTYLCQEKPGGQQGQGQP